ncbi:MAG: hypothetical protein JOZ83_06910 [Silvibacterium sp.]|nr:hypothetical protein [Silvibacterium sp.]
MKREVVGIRMHKCSAEDERNETAARARHPARQKTNSPKRFAKDLYADAGMPLQFVATYDSRLRGLRMAEKTIVEKAAEKVGYGMAMAEDVAGAVKTAVGTAVTTVTDVLSKAPTEKAPAKKAVQGSPAEKAPKKTVAKKPAKAASPKKAAEKVAEKNAVTKKSTKKASAKKVVKKTSAKKAPGKKAAKKL